MSPRSRRVVIPLEEEAAAEIQRRVRVEGVTVRLLVLRALPKVGIAVSAAFLETTKRQGGGNGAGRKRVKRDGYKLTAILPGEVIEALRDVGQRSGVSINYLVRWALHADGYPVGPFELLVDGRKRGTRTPRRHYAWGVRAPRRRVEV